MLKKLFVFLFVLLALASFVHAQETGNQMIVIDGQALKDVGVNVQDGRLVIDLPTLAPVVGAVTAGGVLGGLLIMQVLAFIGFLVLAILIVAFFSKNVELAAAVAEKSAGKSFLWGLLVVLLVLPITLLLIASIVGIVLIPIWVILLMTAAILGFVAVAEIIGDKILKALKIKKPAIMSNVVVGVVILWLVSLIPVIGWIIKLIAVLCGLGAVLVTRLGTIKA